MREYISLFFIYLNKGVDYYKKNIEHLEEQYPNWYSDVKKEKDFNFKQR